MLFSVSLGEDWIRLVQITNRDRWKEQKESSFKYKRNEKMTKRREYLVKGDWFIWYDFGMFLVLGRKLRI